MTTISVAMATWNGARYIGAQLQSLADQTRRPAEVVVTDDCSTDGTLDVVAAFAAKAPFPVRFERNPQQLGYRKNFMKAAVMCQSEFIAFCDQDDVWLPHKLQTCLDAFGNEDTLLVYHNATVVTEELKPYTTLESRAAPREINPPLSLSPWDFGLGFTQVFRRSLFAFDEAWPQSADFIKAGEPEAHDLWFFFLASCLGNIGYIAEPLVLYRQHQANTSGWDSRPKLLVSWSNMVESGVGGFSTRETCARRRASFLERAGKNLRGEREALANKAAAGYRKLEMLYRLRREMYEADSIFSRLSRLKALAGMGGYRPGNEWGAGSKALARDIVRGVLYPAGTFPASAS